MDAELYQFWMWPLAAGLALLWLGLARWQKRLLPGLADFTENRGCCWLAVMGAMMLSVAAGKTWWMCGLIVAVGIVGCVRLNDDAGSGGE